MQHTSAPNNSAQNNSANFDLVVRHRGLGPGVSAVSTTRWGGTSVGPYATLNLGDHVGDDPAHVAANRRLICDHLGVRCLTIADQQHQATVAAIDASLDGAGHTSHHEARTRLAATDALITDLPGVALTILVADCVPVALYDPVNKAIGAAHAGRLGTVAGVVPHAMAAMQARFGTRPQDLRVAFGPHIGPASYEVGGAELAAFRDAFDDEALVLPTAAGKASLDLEGAIRRQLATAGVPADAVSSTGVDTYHATDRYFSDRRERPCGRSALIVWLDGP